MKKTINISAVLGIILFTLAALFSVSLLLAAFDFDGRNPANGTFLFNAGKMFTGVYGFCSVLIPLFLLIAAFQCFTKNWSSRNGILLLGSVIPFFTLDALEHIIRMICASNEGDVLLMKLITALITGLVIVAIEYLVLSIIGDFIERKSDSAVYKAELSESKTADRNDNPADGWHEESDSEMTENPFAEADDYNKDDNVIDSDKEPASESSEPFDSDDNKNTDMTEESVFQNDNAEKAPAAEILSESSDSSAEENPFEHIFDRTDEVDDIDAQSKEDAGTDTVNADDVNAEDSADFIEEQNPAAEEDVLSEPADDAEEDFPELSISEALADSEIPDAQDNISDIYIPDEPEDSDDYDETFVSDSDIQDDDEEYEYEAEDSALYDDNDGYYDSDSDSDEEENDEDSLPEEFIQHEDYSVPESDDNFDTDENFYVMPEDSDVEDTDAAEPEIPAEKDFDKDMNFFDDTVSEDEAGNDSEEEEDSYPDSMGNEFRDIFSEMERDAADSSLAGEEDFSEPVLPPESDRDEGIEIQKDYEFDPSAAPVVDSNGIPFGTAVPIDIEKVIKDKKSLYTEDKISPDLGRHFSDSEMADFDVEDFSIEEITDDLKSEKAFPSDERQSEKSILSVSKEEKPEKKRLKLSSYNIPTENILNTYPNGEYWIIDEETKKAAADLKDTLNEFKIEAEVTGIRKGPVVTMFEILPAPGVKLSKIVALQDNIALRLAASSVRIVAPIPGKHAVGIEVPNKERAVVSFKEIIEKPVAEFSKMAIPVVLGKDISGEPQVLDLAKTPHLLIAGSTGAGKSVCVNSMLLSILYKRSPQQVKLVLIDPKIVELKLYNDIPHLLTPVITEPKKALQSLQYCLCEMERRYAMLDSMGVRDISSYNRRIVERKICQEKLPYIVVIIDEFADLMATTGKELESTIARLAAMSRAVGIHLVLATQRPSIDVITGLIKANIPSRIAFMVASKMDSRIIIDQVGAEKLLGKGDMLYASATDPFPVRIQGALVSDDEVERVVEYVKQYGEPEYIDDEMFVDDEDDEGAVPGLFNDGEDPLYDQALQIVVQAGKASASYIQRRLKIGYNRAARLVEEMESRGIVGPQNGSKPREIIHMP